MAATDPGRTSVLWFDKRDVARAWTIRTREKENKTSGGMPMRPGLDAIYEALRRAIRDDPRLLERKAEEVSKELVRGGLDLAPNRKHLPFFAACLSDKASRRADKGRKARLLTHLGHKRAKCWPVSVSPPRGT